MELKNYIESKNIIEEVVKNSIAEELDIQPGDILISINEVLVKDIIDYKYLLSDEDILLEIQKKNGEIWEFEIEKDIQEDLGIIFTNPLIDKAKSCKNQCMFCFIDQLPENMRDSLYFKDDDSRLSFLQGNFITLTNMNEDEIDRIIRYRISPINVSVHTTNPELRIKMLKNKNAGKVYDILKRFHQANLKVNCQIVLIPGVNDGIELENTLLDLKKLYPTIESIAVVPVGLTRHRKGLEELKPYNEELSKELLDYIFKLQDRFLKELATRFVFPSDEFFILAKYEIPSFEEYEGFPQLENGVGLLKSFEMEVENILDNMEETYLNKKLILVTGTLAKNFMEKIALKIKEKIKGLSLEIVPIENNFFGHSITVSGLVTANDIIGQLKGINADGIVIPRSMLRSQGDVFLDDLTVDDISRELGTRVIVSNVDGKNLIDILKLEVKK